MFDIGFGEMLLVALLALLVLGPQRLPGAARTLGALLRRARESWNGVRAGFENELRVEELRHSMRQTAQQARRYKKTLGDAARDVVNDVRDPIAVHDNDADKTSDDAPAAPAAAHAQEHVRGGG